MRAAGAGRVGVVRLETDPGLECGGVEGGAERELEAGSDLEDAGTDKRVILESSADKVSLFVAGASDASFATSAKACRAWHSRMLNHSSHSFLASSFLALVSTAVCAALERRSVLACSCARDPGMMIAEGLDWI